MTDKEKKTQRDNRLEYLCDRYNRTRVALRSKGAKDWMDKRELSLLTQLANHTRKQLANLLAVEADHATE